MVGVRGLSYYIPTTPLLFSEISTSVAFTNDLELAYVYKSPLYFPGMQNDSKTALQTLDPGSSLISTAQAPLNTADNLQFPCPNNPPVANLYGFLDAVRTFPAMGPECAALTFPVDRAYTNFTLGNDTLCGYQTGYVSGLVVNGVFVETTVAFPQARVIGSAPKQHQSQSDDGLVVDVAMGVNAPESAFDATCDESPGLVGMDRSNISLVNQLASQGVIDGNALSQCGTLAQGESEGSFVILGPDVPDQLEIESVSKLYSTSKMMEEFGDSDPLLSSWIQALKDDAGSRYSYFTMVKGVSINGTDVDEPTVAVPYTFDTGIPGLLVTPQDWKAMYDYVEKKNNDNNSSAGRYNVTTLEQNLGTLVAVQPLDDVYSIKSVLALFPTLTFTFMNGDTVDVAPESFVTSTVLTPDSAPLFVAIVASYDTAVGGSLASEPRGTFGAPIVHHRMVTANSDESILYFSKDIPGCDVSGMTFSNSMVDGTGSIPDVLSSSWPNGRLVAALVCCVIFHMLWYLAVE